MSRSTTALTKELFSGAHLVAITEVKIINDDILIRFSSGHNKHFDKIYSLDSEFIKMCGDAGIINDTSVFDNVEAIGKRLWVNIKEVWNTPENVSFEIYETYPYVPQGEATVKPETPKTSKFQDKLKIIEEQRAMIAKVESKKDDLDIM